MRMIIGVGAAVFWLLVLALPLGIMMSVGIGAPSNLFVFIPKAFAALPALALFMAGVPEALAKQLGAGIAIFAFVCAVAQIVLAIRGRREKS